MKTIVRWAVIGPGSIASSMVRDMRSVPGSRITGVVSRNPERARQKAQEWGADYWNSSLEALLDTGKIDAVYIATPHSEHLHAALTAIDRGIPVLCEKPLTIGYHQSRELVSRAREKKVLLMEGLWSKFHPLIRKLWDFLDQGHLGQIRSMRLSFGFKSNFDPNSRLYNPKLGGGATLDLGIYPLWFPIAFWGEPRVIHSIGTQATTGVDEASITTLKFSNGAMASCESSMVYPMDNCAHIYGTKGRILVESNWFVPNKIRLYPLEGREESWTHRSKTIGLNHEVAHFQQLLAKGDLESPIHSLDDSLLLAKVMDQVMSQI